MTSTEVRDKKIALTERRITDAQTALGTHQHHIERLLAEIARHNRELEWLKAMPVTDSPPSELPTDILHPANTNPKD